MKSVKLHNKPFALLLPIILALSVTTFGQSTEFTYQGKLLDGALPPTANYDFEFRLFSVDTGGTAIITVQRLNVAVTSGIFTVKLDFGANFGGGPRWLEIAVRPAGGGAFTQLAPRQPVTSTPYAIRSLGSTTADGLSVACVNCITSSQIQSVNGSAVTGAIPVASVPAGSTNYIQNTGAQQASANFNISGNGTAGGTLSAGAVNAATQYNLGGQRLLSGAGFLNFFAGINAGTNTTSTHNAFFGAAAGSANSSGGGNAFFGALAGFSNTTGGTNSFFGALAGQDNTASNNAFFGYAAGANNTLGTENSFFGFEAGKVNAEGVWNSFFGYRAGANNRIVGGPGASYNSFFGSKAGEANTTGDFNTFVGAGAGYQNTTGQLNSFFGSGAGSSNTTGDQNAFFGNSAGAANTTADNNSFFGSYAGISNTASENSFFGSSAGFSNTTGDSNAFFGNSAGRANTTGRGNAIFGSNAGYSNEGSLNALFGYLAGNENTTGTSNAFFGFQAGTQNTTGSNNTVIGYNANVGSGSLNYATAIGAGAVVSTSNTIMLGREDGSDVVQVPGKLQVDILGTAGSTQLCLNSSNRLAPCSSSLRYKTNIAPYGKGLAIINQLRPITFNWKADRKPDVGLGAEEVEQVEPLLVTYNKDGQVEGVKYDRIAVVLLNAVKEQQSQINQQAEQIQNQQREIAALKKLLCPGWPKAEVCRPAARRVAAARK